MKKFAYILIALFGIAIASCQKQDIKPVSGEAVMPTWSSNERGAGEAGDDSGVTFGDDDNGDVGIDNGGITDPNNDPDGSKKGKGNQ